MNDELFLITMTVLAAVGLWWLYFMEYKPYRIARTRQDLFAIRDKLFEQAKEGVIPFDAKAYGITRTTLNGMIQFTHDLSFVRLVIIVITHKYSEDTNAVETYKKEMDEAIRALPKPARRAILEARLYMHLTMLTHIVRSSIILMIIVEPLRIILQLLHKWQQVRQKYVVGRRAQTRWSVVDAEANGIGMDTALARR